MVTLEQIRQLDARVRRAVELIGKLKEENINLKGRLTEYQERIEELEVLISNFKEDQGEIEQGLANVLSELAAIDDAPKSPARPAAAERKVAPQPSPRRPAPVAAPPDKEKDSESADNPEAELDIF